MRVRILITNGPRTVDLFWLQHDGKDVYCGPSKVDQKRTYHESGIVHSTTDSGRQHEGRHVPLKELKGQFHLMSINIGNAAAYVEKQASRHEYQGGKSDTLMVVDSRTIPDNVQTNIAVGLLEPRDLSPLTPIIVRHTLGDNVELACQQVLLATSIDPWVYVTVHWLKTNAAQHL